MCDNELETIGADTLDDCDRAILEAVTQTDSFEVAAVALASSRGHAGDENPHAYVEAFADVVNYATAHALAVIKSHWTGDTES